MTERDRGRGVDTRKRGRKTEIRRDGERREIKISERKIEKKRRNLNLNLNLFLLYNGYKLGRTPLFIWPLIL